MADIFQALQEFGFANSPTYKVLQESMPADMPEHVKELLRNPTVAAQAHRSMGQSRGIDGYGDMYQKLLGRAGAAQGPNPYDTSVANQARPMQTVALDMMRKQLGQSSVGMQGAAALSQANQQAQRALAGQGALAGRTGMGAVAGQSAGIAGDVAGARLREYLMGQQGLMQGAGGMRGADLSTQSADSQAGQSNIALGNRRQASALAMASDAKRANERAMLEQYKLYQALNIGGQKQAIDTMGRVVSGGTTMLASGAKL